jgi:hypothetical protein
VTPAAVSADRTLSLSPALLAAFGEVSPALLESRALLDRVDRKYLLPIALLEPLLARLTVGYRVLKAAGHMVATYDTRYFDTPDRRMYDDHRRGRRPRHKVRIRHHVERQVSFLEIKRKAGDRQTSKWRRAHDFGDSVLGEDSRRFIDRHCPLEAATLVPRVDVTFSRMTLVGQQANERLTLDWLLQYSDGIRRESLGGVVIAEVKQGRFSNSSPSIRALRELGVREGSISKYCLATARLSNVRTNTFKAALKAVESIAS